MRLTDKACMLDITGENNEFFYIKDSQNITDDEILNKLGQYEDIDENPEKLAKIKKALEIIKEMLDNDLTEKLNANSRKIFKDIFDNLPKEKQDLLKEILL